MRYSVIIVSYNTKKLLLQCIDSIYERCQGADFEVIVVDNDSGDGSAEAVAQAFAGRVLIIANQANLGFGAANNIGSRAATGEYLIFLNSDTILQSDLSRLLEPFGSDQATGMTAPILELPDHSKQPYSFGMFSKSVCSYVLERFISPKMPPEIAGQRSVDWVSGAAMAVPKKVFEQVGGFDERFFMYFEDMDLCRRVREAGHRIAVVSSLSVTHFVGQSTESIFQVRKKYYYESQDYYFSKYYPRAEALAFRLLRVPLKVFIFLFKR